MATARDTAFTLIELLVVIAILGILASLLMPAIASVRSSAKTIACSRNLGQIQLANELYANDYEGQYVPICGLGSADDAQWFGQMAFRAYWGLEGTNARIPRNRLCPDSAGAKTETANHSYGMNVYAYGATPPSGAVDTLNSSLWHPIKPCLFVRSAVARPADKAAVVDALDYWVTYWNTPNYAASHEQTPSTAVMETAYRHRNAANVAFFDGHTQTMNRSTLDRLQAPAAGNQTWAVVRP